MRKRRNEPDGNERQRPASMVAGMPPNPNALCEDGKTIKRLSFENITLRFLAQALRLGAQVSGGMKGAARRWGSTDWARVQEYIDSRHRRYPGHSYNALTADAAKSFGVSQKTIKRHCISPKAN